MADQYRRYINEGAFLFDEEIKIYLDTVNTRINSLNLLIGLTNQKIDLDAKHREEMYDILSWIGEEINDVQNKFEEFLRLDI